LSNLQTWKHSAIVIDIKGELYRATGGQRSKLGKVYVLDPSGQGHQYDPFEELSTSPEAMRAAANLLMKHEDDKDPIFAQRAANGLYAALRAADLQHLPRLPFLRALTAETLLEPVRQRIVNAERL
jgi:type IV secretion system protein VirD4